MTPVSIAFRWAMLCTKSELRFRQYSFNHRTRNLRSVEVLRLTPYPLYQHALTAIRKGDGMAGFINIAIVAACSARCLSPSTKETEKCQTLLLIFFITTTVAPYLSSKWLRYSFHHYYGTQDRFGQISPSLSTTTGMCGLPKMGAKKTPRTFKKSVALQLGRYSIFISIM